MNSMRLLILLTFVLYETQRAESTLTYLKSLLKKHLHTTPEPPTPISECKHHVEYGANGDAVAEWNRQLTLNEKPTIIEIDEQGNVGSLNVEEQPKQNENPILLEIDDKGGVRNINSEEVTVQNDHRILIEIDDEGNASSYNADGNSNENENPIIVEIDDTGKIVRVITKTIPENRAQTADENTSWLLGEKPSENQSEGDGGKLHGVFESIKEKIVAKINAIKSKLNPKKEVVEKPVTENVLDSEFLLEEKNNNYGLPSTAAVLPVSTAEPVVVTGKPMAVAVSSTTAGVPVAAGSPRTTTGTPVTAGVPVAAGTPFIAAGPSDDGYGPLQEQPQVVSIPDRRRVPFPVRTVYYSPLPYPMQWFGQPQYAAVQTAFAPRPQPTIENTPYYVAPAGNLYQNFGYVPSGRPAFVAPPGQWIRYAAAGDYGPKYVRPVSPAPSVQPYAPSVQPYAPSVQPFAPSVQPYAPPARTSAVPEEPSTMRPIAVYSTAAASVSPPPITRPQEAVTAAEDDWNRAVQENASILSGVEGSSEYPSRGDVPSYAGNDGANVVQYGPPEGTDNGYLQLMERRNALDDDVAVEKNARPTTPAVDGTPATRPKSEKKPTNSKSEKKPVDSKPEKKPTDPKSA